MLRQGGVGEGEDGDEKGHGGGRWETRWEGDIDGGWR